MSPLQAKIGAAFVSALFAGLAAGFPAYAVPLAGVATYILGAAFHQRPGDVKAAQ